MERDHYVYVARDARGLVLYVGCTANLRQRRTSHASTSPWWPYLSRTTLHGPYRRDVAYRIEGDKIRDLRPFFNSHADQQAHNKQRDAYRSQRLRAMCDELGIKTGPGADASQFDDFQRVFDAADQEAESAIGPRITKETRAAAYLLARVA